MVEAEDWRARLRGLRLTLGWSQRRLAREFRVTVGAVSQWESGKRGVPGPVRRLTELYERGVVRPIRS